MSDGLTLSAVGAMAVFAFGATWTPGPNNMMLASSGATYGFRSSIPHALGVACGFPLMFFAVALGFETALTYAETTLVRVHPLFGHLRTALLYLAAAVMVWFGVRIALSGRKSVAKAEKGEDELSLAAPRRPFTFWEAAAFQWVNPKAWAMAIGAANLYLSGASPLTKALVGAGIFLISGLTSAHSWAAFGAALSRALQHGARLRVFNLTMGGLVIASVGFLFLD
ncbi:MAG: LysE family translocator [Neomegalonema sp.]|nr:LysE family translocator [Neomegalonema sp.]